MYFEAEKMLLNFAITPLPHDFKRDRTKLCNIIELLIELEENYHIVDRMHAGQILLNLLRNFRCSRISITVEQFVAFLPLHFSDGALTWKILSGYIHICTRIIILENKIIETIEIGRKDNQKKWITRERNRRCVICKDFMHRIRERLYKLLTE